MLGERRVTEWQHSNAILMHGSVHYSWLPRGGSMLAGSSLSQARICEESTSRLGEYGLIVPANTARPSSSLERAKIFASASVANVLVSRGLRCLGSMPLLRSSTETYQIGVAAPVNVTLGKRGGRIVPWEYAQAFDVARIEWLARNHIAACGF